MLPTLFSTTHSTTPTRSPAYLALIAVIAVGATGCNGAFVGNFVVLGLTLGVFFGTLGLGRARPAPATPRPTPADSSQSDV